MSKSGIPYVDVSWNPVTGCPPDEYNVTCRDHCWAARMASRFPLTHAGWPEGDVWKDPIPFSQITLHPERLDQPLHWRKARVVLVSAMGDLFHADVPLDFIAAVGNIMADAPRHTYLLLTKRPENVRAGMGCALVGMSQAWLLVSVWDQESANRMIPIVLETPAAHRGVSVEPMLAAVDLRPWLGSGKLDQVIAGSESGPGARPADYRWFLDLEDQCRQAAVPCFVKQVSGAPGDRKVIRFEPEPGQLAWRP